MKQTRRIKAASLSYTLYSNRQNRYRSMLKMFRHSNGLGGQWGDAFSVTVNGKMKPLKNPPQQRPWAKCTRCKWFGAMPLESDK